MNTTSRNPDSVSSENITPEDARSERTIFITPIDSADLEVIEALVDPVVDRAVGEQAGEAAPAGVEQALLAPDVQVGLLLAGEARGRKILGGGRAAHGQADVLAVLLLQARVGDGISCGELVRQAGPVDDLPGALAAPRQVGHVVGVEVVERVVRAAPGRPRARACTGRRRR